MLLLAAACAQTGISWISLRTVVAISIVDFVSTRSANTLQSCTQAIVAGEFGGNWGVGIVNWGSDQVNWGSDQLNALILIVFRVKKGGFRGLIEVFCCQNHWSSKQDPYANCAMLKRRFFDAKMSD
jgi:hypothetical protein